MKPETRDLLVKILTKRDVSLVKCLNQGEMSSSDIEKVVAALNDEFLSVGINENFEPNAIGLEIENLIDIVNKKRWMTGSPPARG